jgi:hypothetical protein
MKKFIILIVAIWAFGLILLPRLAETEMTELTEEQMTAPMLKHNNFSLWAVFGSKRDTVTESKIENEDLLFGDEEEVRLDTHIKVQEILGLEIDKTERITHSWEGVYPGDAIHEIEDMRRAVFNRELDISNH